MKLIRALVNLVALVLVLTVVVPLSAQDTLSNQVLRLLTRINSWTGTNTFSDFRVSNAAVPSTTTYRIYADQVGNLYFNGGLIAGAGGGVTPHNLLSSTHPDTTPGSPSRGDLLSGQGTTTATWKRLGIGTSGYFAESNGLDIVFNNDGTALVNIPAGQLTGTIAAISGTNVTNLNASNLASGTVPIARLSGITSTQLSASAAIVRSQLSIPAGITLTTDVTGILPFANGGTGLSTAVDDTVLVSSGAAWVAKAVPNCTSNTSALGYTTATNTFSCIAVNVGTGTVTSVAMTVPTGFAIGGTPITTSGTLALTLSNETANFVWAGPASGAAAAPAFRALVSADFPASGVGTGTYAKVTVNSRGIVTAGSTQITLTTDVTGTLPLANGGTGVTAAGDDTVLIGSGASWVAQTLPNCTYGLLAYTTASNSFTCPTSLAASAAGTGTLGTLALPFASLFTGTAATNNLQIKPAAFGQATTATVSDPGIGDVKLVLALRGTLAYAGTQVSPVACGAATTASATGLTGTATVTFSFNAAPGANWQKGLYPLFYPTAGLVNMIACNGTATTVTLDNATFNWTAVVP